MHPLKQLRDLLRVAEPSSGTVVKTGSNMTIATVNGVQAITPLPGDVTSYRVGDTVVIKNGILIGRRNYNSDIYVV